ncbi:MAG: hypothetical protein WC378_00225 [Opitutaceae bacterium]|jgi:glucosamine--fructose-6-phosphate aminotransferase (isomerizing)
MCGIFGFITKNGRGPNIDRLKRIALETETRGRHAFGLAWVDQSWAIHTYKQAGPASANLEALEACRDALAVIGHCRWATHGDPEDNCNNHPHPAGSGWIVHNGVVSNYRELSRRYRLRPKSECDSEILGLMIARFPGEIGMRSAMAAEQATAPLAMLGLWRKPVRLMIARKGNPLCFGESKRGFYLASLPSGLPGTIKAIRNNYVGVLTFDGAELEYDAFSVTR